MEILGKTAVFRADMAGLGKYCIGGYGRIGVYRVNVRLQPDTCTEYVCCSQWILMSPTHSSLTTQLLNATG